MSAPNIVVRHDILSVDASRRLVGRSRSTVINWILQGEIRAEKIGGWYFCARSDIERIARQQADRMLADAAVEA